MQKKLERISNTYYNEALSYAKKRDLESAIKYLKIALSYNKKNIDARNLLGLIYLEVGEISLSLISFIISLDIKKHNNLAEYYLHKIRKNKNKLSLYDKNIIRYNEALGHIENENFDLAIINLNKIYRSNKNYIKANLLLSLLYIQKKEYLKSMKVLNTILSIDKFNHLALRYKVYIEEDKKSEDLKKDTNDFLKLSNDVIMPANYKAYTGLYTIVNIGMGLIIGISSILFLYLPTMKARLNDTYNKEYNRIFSVLSDTQIKKDEISSDLDKLEKKYERLLELSNTSKENINYKSLQYQKLLLMQEAYLKNDFLKLAETYVDFDFLALEDIDDGSGYKVSENIKKLQNEVKEKGTPLLLKKGDEFYRSEEFESAFSYYEKAESLESDNLEAKLKKARTLLKMQQVEEANIIFSDIIINYPDSKEAESAKKERGY